MMHALIRDRGAVRLAEIPEPAIASGDDVRVRVLCAGVCRTDVYVAEGRIPVAEPRVLGHEFCGLVDAVGASVTALRPGDFVTAMPLLACDECAACRAGDPCVDPRMLGVDRDGAFAEKVVVPARAVHRAEGLTLRRAAYVEPMAASMAVLHVGLERGARGLVCGSGRVAELTRRVLARDGFERVAVWDPRREAPPAPGSLDFAIETVATEEVLRALIDALRVGGTLVLKSRPFDAVPLDVAAAVRRQARLVAARYAPVERAIEALREGGPAFDDLLGPAHPLRQWDRAFAAREDVKVFLRPTEEASRLFGEAAVRG